MKKKKPFKVSKSISKGVLSYIARRGEKIIYKAKSLMDLEKLISKKKSDVKKTDAKKVAVKKTEDKKSEVMLKI